MYAHQPSAPLSSAQAERTLSDNKPPATFRAPLVMGRFRLLLYTTRAAAPAARGCR